MSRSTFTCPGCQRLLLMPVGDPPTSAMCCPSCRTTVERPSSAIVEEPRTKRNGETSAILEHSPCRRCRAKVRPDWTFCSICGATLESDERVRAEKPRPTVWKNEETGEVEVGEAMLLTSISLGGSAALVFMVADLAGVTSCLLMLGVGVFMVALTFWK